jgi:hypothetical protein
MEKVINFYLTDISENDFYFEGCNETLTEEKVTELFKDIRKQDWFVEGNKTEGTITFMGGTEVLIEWEVKTMGEDWDTDESEEHEHTYQQNIIVL